MSGSIGPRGGFPNCLGLWDFGKAKISGGKAVVFSIHALIEQIKASYGSECLTNLTIPIRANSWESRMVRLGEGYPGGAYGRNNVVGP